MDNMYNFNRISIISRINAAIETVVDMFTREKNELAGKAKDISAGAVLILAIASAIVGGIIFIPKIIELIK